MSKKNRDGKPTAFQVKTIKDLGGSAKGIKTYRDAENAIKRLRTARKGKPVKAAVAAKKPTKKAEPAKKAAPVKKVAKVQEKKSVKNATPAKKPAAKVTQKKPVPAVSAPEKCKKPTKANPKKSNAIRGVEAFGITRGEIAKIAGVIGIVVNKGIRSLINEIMADAKKQCACCKKK